MKETIVKSAARVFEVLEFFDDVRRPATVIEIARVQRRLAEGAYRDQCAIERGEELVVGVNAFKVDEPEQTPVFRVDPAAAERQVGKLEELRRKRDNAKVANTLEALRKVCASRDNVMPATLDCVKAFATVGEIGQVWRDVYGEYVPETQRF